MVASGCALPSGIDVDRLEIRARRPIAEHRPAGNASLAVPDHEEHQAQDRPWFVVR